MRNECSKDCTNSLPVVLVDVSILEVVLGVLSVLMGVAADVGGDVKGLLSVSDAAPCPCGCAAAGSVSVALAIASLWW